jgi:MSHA biogenesis protein MshG
MAKFSYKAKNRQGRLLEGVMEAPTQAQAEKILADNLYEVLSLAKLKTEWTLKGLLAQFETVPPSQFVFFIRQLATLLKAGVPMLTTLEALQEEIRNPLLKGAVGTIYRDVQRGESFSFAVSQHPRVFNTLFVSMIRAGEATGELDTTLLRLAETFEKDYSTRSKIKAALRYPIFVLFVMFAAFLIATLFIIPRFKTLFDAFSASLPLPTKILLGLSWLVTHCWFLLFLAAVGLAVAFYYHYRTYHGRRFWDKFFLQLPIIDTFIRYAVFSRFGRMLGILLKSGVSILTSLELLSQIVGNAIVADAILRMKDRIAQGETMSIQMRREKIFPNLLIQMVNAGEISGKVDELVIEIADYYESELDLLTRNIESLIEPIFIFILASFVLVLALGIFLPMWNLYSIVATQAGK